VNREELNWLLETIQDAKIAERSCWLSTSAAEFPLRRWPMVARERVGSTTQRINS